MEKLPLVDANSTTRYRKTNERGEAIYDTPELDEVWLDEVLEADEHKFRLLERYDLKSSVSDTSSIGFSDHILNQTVSHTSIFNNLLQSQTGGALLLNDYPWGFYLQSPKKCGSHAVLALQQRGHYIRGIYIYTNDAFAPSALFETHSWMVVPNMWRDAGPHILNMPIAFLSAHVKYSTAVLTELLDELSRIEAYLAAPNAYLKADLMHATDKLHILASQLSQVETLTSFETSLLASIQKGHDSAMKRAYYSSAGIVDAAITAADLAHSLRKPELERGARRIEFQRSMVFNLSVQRNQAETLQARRINLKIAQSSAVIAQASLKDARSMRIIAIVTLMFLPGTAVATFFSMTMFNWQASGSAVASEYVWVYFVVTIPLTALVLGVWWMFDRRRSRTVKHAVLDDELEEQELEL